MKTKLYQIYAVENDAGLIKIGITRDFEKRLKSLSNSNSGGHKIINTYTSPFTYLYTLEHRLHTIYDTYRVEGEWFKGLNFTEVINTIETIFTSKEYELCNSVREQFELKRAARQTEPIEIEREF